MEKINKYFIVFVLMVFWSSYSFSSQKFSVADGDVIKVKLSSRDLTRITVEGGKIEKLWGPSGILETQSDKKEGEIFLKPGLNAGNALSFFVRDNFGSTYTIIGEQFDIPSQTIALSPLRKLSKTSKDKLKSHSIVKEIKSIIKAMSQGDIEGNYESVIVNKEISLWKEVKVNHIKDLLGEKIIGEVYQLQNISLVEMKFTEEEFLNFRPDILAVSIDRLMVPKNELTQFYIIRRR